MVFCWFIKMFAVKFYCKKPNNSWQTLEKEKIKEF